MQLLSYSRLTQVLLTALLSASTINALAPTKRAKICNGHSKLCERSYSAVSYVGTHDSYAIGVYNLAVNQDQPITTQLNDGVRMLQMQAHNQSGTIRLCRTSCSLYDAGSLEDYLKIVKAWLDANPNEVLSLLIVNIDNLPASKYDTVFKSVGLDSVSFAPSSSPLAASSWPTLGSMIDSGKRLVTFLDNGADSSIPYLIDEFTNMWETAFNIVDPAGFDCTVNRTKGDTSTQLYLINHFLDRIVFNETVPDVTKASVTNAASGSGSLGAHVDTCKAANSRAPNFLLVDFYEYGGGSVFQVAADINGVQYSPTRPVATPSYTLSTPSPTSSSASSSGSRSQGNEYSSTTSVATPSPLSSSASSSGSSSQGNGAVEFALKQYAMTSIVVSLGVATGLAMVL